MAKTTKKTLPKGPHALTKAAEARETPAQERRESPAFEKMERKMGIEKYMAKPKKRKM